MGCSQILRPAEALWGSSWQHCQLEMVVKERRMEIDSDPQQWMTKSLTCPYQLHQGLMTYAVSEIFGYEQNAEEHRWRF